MIPEDKRPSIRTLRIAGIILTAIFLILSAYFFKTFLRANVHTIAYASDSMKQSDDGSLLSMGGLELPSGAYILSMDYSLTGGDALARLNLEEGNGEIVLHISPDSDISEPLYYNFILENSIDNGRLSIETSDNSHFVLNSLTLYSDKRIFSDGLVYAVICLMAIAVIWIMIRKIKIGYDPLVLLTATLMFLVTTVPFLFVRMQPVGGDLRGHLMRIEGTYFGLTDGQFPVVINPNWNNRHGQLGILYPDLFLYPIAILRMLRVSLYCCAKIMMMLVNSISAFVFYKASKVLLDKRRYQILAVFLMTFEYTRIYGITYGGKLGGALLAEIFIPLIIAGLVDILYQEGSKWYYLAIGLAGVFCSHILSSVISVAMILMFSLFSIKRFRIKTVWYGIVKAVALFTGLIFGTYVAFLHYFFIDWSSSNLKWRDFVSTLWRISDFFYDNRWTYAFIVLIVCILLFILTLLRRRAEETDLPPFTIPLLATAFIFFFMATAYFPWVALRNIPIIRSLTDFLQSSNRFLNMVGTLCAFIIPILLKGKGRVFNVAVCTALFAYCLGGSWYALNVDMPGYITIQDETVAYIDFNYEDYLPTGTLTEYYASDTGYVSDENIVDTLSYHKAGTHVRYSYKASGEGEYAEFPLFWYDGYFATDETGAPVELIRDSKNRIRVDLEKTDTAKTINISYRIPSYITVCYILSAILWILTISYESLKRFPRFRINFNRSR